MAVTYARNVWSPAAPAAGQACQTGPSSRLASSSPTQNVTYGAQGARFRPVADGPNRPTTTTSVDSARVMTRSTDPQPRGVEGRLHARGQRDATAIAAP